MQKNFILIISSPSGVGKTTLTKMLLAKHSDLCVSVSFTTRPIRPGEVNGNDYYFVDDTQFKTMIDNGEFLEHAKVFGHYYGTHVSSLHKAFDQHQNLVFDIDWQGTMELKATIPENIVSIFILPPSMAELERRLKTRDKDKCDQITLRLSKAREEISKYKIYDYILINDDLTTCFEQINHIYEAAKLKRNVLDKEVQLLLAQ